ncbi:hypothetical protein M5K25_028442 [Dendrobium thyrsiflorum]|uniref:Uncharacterized protein n=1 Tax=Dendrobium thyrsiflorum TaxID=117978 RepID=A0ABD0TT96_DENTH
MRQLYYNRGSIVSKLIVKLSVSELRTQRHQNRLNPSPDESKSMTRSAVGSRIERLDETNPTSPRTQKSDISKSENRPSNRPQSRDSISTTQSLKESRERSKTTLAPLLLLDHRWSSAGPPPEGSALRRTTA